MTSSKPPSMAEGAGLGAVKPVTVTSGVSVDLTISRHACVIEGVALGLQRRMRICLVPVVPVTDCRH